MAEMVLENAGTALERRRDVWSEQEQTEFTAGSSSEEEDIMGRIKLKTRVQEKSSDEIFGWRRWQWQKQQQQQ